MSAARCGNAPGASSPATRRLTVARADLEREDVASLQLELLRGLRADEDGVGVEEVEHRNLEIRQQRRLHRPGAQQVEPEHLDRLAAAGKLRVDLDRRACHLDAGQSRDHGEDRLVEASCAGRAPPGLPPQKAH